MQTLDIYDWAEYLDFPPESIQAVSEPPVDSSELRIDSTTKVATTVYLIDHNSPQRWLMGPSKNPKPLNEREGSLKK